MTILENFRKIQNDVSKINKNVTIISVSKTFKLRDINPLIQLGHLHFGENKVQEAKDKWSGLIESNFPLKLHMIGKLQSNKAYDAIKLFSYIHSLDNEKLAFKLATYEKELSKKLKYFIQVNLSEENQKSGIQVKDLSNFIKYCKLDNQLDVIGLMCLPPVDLDPTNFFSKLNDLAKQSNLQELSMGMSGDYKIAIENGSTFIRLGSVIFGKRS
jgi:pyridoxal phosphate enzyme (YggS family)